MHKQWPLEQVPEACTLQVCQGQEVLQSAGSLGLDSDSAIEFCELVRFGGSDVWPGALRETVPSMPGGVLLIVFRSRN